VRRALCPVLLIVVASIGPLQAQSADPLSAAAKHTYDIVTGYIAKAAAQVPEELYAFQPTPDIRTLGQLFAHVADANFALCSVVAQEKPPAGGIEKSKTSKADLAKALAESFAYCGAVHGKMTDSTGSAIVKFMAAGRRLEVMPKLSVLEYNTHHTFEHYGNIVTYMRLKGLVPPSSQ